MPSPFTYQEQQLIQLVKWQQSSQQVYYYINIIDGEEFPTLLEQDFPWHEQQQVLYFEEAIFQQVLEPYLDWSEEGWEAMADACYNWPYTWNKLQEGGIDEEIIVLETLNLMQDILVLTCPDWKSRWPQFILAANYCTFSKDITGLFQAKGVNPQQLLIEIEAINKWIQQHACLQQVPKPLPFEPFFF